MHLISELSDRLASQSRLVSEERMISKKDISILESIAFLHAIEQCEGKRKASEQLCTSIDTINKYLDNLEQTLGVKLISTSSKGSSLTGVAQRIVEKAERIKEVLAYDVSVELNKPDSIEYKDKEIEEDEI